MKLKKISFAAASIISLFILLINANCSAEEDNIKYYSDEMGTLAIMYHRFNEPKYPSTNIQMDIFKKQMDIINDNNYTFYNPNEFAKNLLGHLNCLIKPTSPCDCRKFCFTSS